MSKIRVAIVGVGNCASSLVQGVTYYKDAKPEDTSPGIMHVQFGDYDIDEVEFVATRGGGGILDLHGHDRVTLQ